MLDLPPLDPDHHQFSTSIVLAAKDNLTLYSRPMWNNKCLMLPWLHRLALHMSPYRILGISELHIAMGVVSAFCFFMIYDIKE